MGTYCFGIDVGGTTIKCGLFRTDGTLVEKWEIPTRRENNGDKILPDVGDTINNKIKERNIGIKLLIQSIRVILFRFNFKTIKYVFIKIKTS